jgi:glucosamine--fructose-6-phosphate aminotransferase (isomerizing)
MRGGLTIAEIREQPEVLARLLEVERRPLLRLASSLRRRRPPVVFLAARGTSDNAALYGHYLFETLLGIPAGLASPSVVTIYRKVPRLRGALVLGLSQSGRSSDIVRYVEAARSSGARTVAVTNDPRSPLAAAAHDTLLLHAGIERSVAATKTYTAQLTLLSLLVAAMAGDRQLLQDHDGLPGWVDHALNAEDSVRRLSRRLSRAHRCLVTARGYNFATAREAALKLKETAQVAAEALSSADLLHGPIAVVGPRFPVIMIAPPGPTRGHLSRVARRLVAQNARLVIVAPGRGLEDLPHSTVPMPTGVREILTPHVSIVPLQLLAYHLALARGFDPDRPRGLRKVTRSL